MPASLPSLPIALIAFRFFHFPCSLQNHLTGVVLPSEVGFLSGLLRFALLTSTAQDYLPKSKQNMALLVSGEISGGRLGYPGVCARVGQHGSLDPWHFDV